MPLSERLETKLSLSQHASEVIELQGMDNKLNFLNSLPNFFNGWMQFGIILLQRTRVDAVNMYLSREKARETLTFALDSKGNSSAWYKAEHAAEELDLSIRTFLIRKNLESLQIHNALFLGSYLNIVFMGSFGGFLAGCLLKAVTSIDYDVIAQYRMNILQIMLALLSLLVLLKEKDNLTSDCNILFFGLGLTDEVRRVALEAGVELGKGRRLADSNSLISQLMNVRDNEKALEGISCIDVPLKLSCAITKSVLTDPVYSDQNPERFERKEILNWLKMKEIHPITRQALYVDDLKRDFDLKREVDAYVDNELEVDRKYAKARKALIGLSSFSEVLDDGQDTLGDLYQNKFC